MKKAYLYPNSANTSAVSLYIKHFIEYLSGNFIFVNKEKPSSKGILNIFSFIKNLDVVFLNWIEDLPDKRGGIFQSIVFVVLIYFFKFLKIKIVWIMHNKMSHYESHAFLKKFIFNFILRKSDYIITHSRSGLEYYEQFRTGKPDKIRYFPHPLNQDFIKFNNKPSIDILIWGTIIPYKGIDKFLKYLYDRNLQNRYKIKIIGKVKPETYSEVIISLCNQVIIHDNRYISEAELKKLHADSRIVLFTYVGDSVLSSGALMDSLSFGAEIVGPSAGAFRDAAEDGLIKTFNTFDDLIPLLDQILEHPFHDKENVIGRFIEDNNWSQFSNKIIQWVKG